MKSWTIPNPCPNCGAKSGMQVRCKKCGALGCSTSKCFGANPANLTKCPACKQSSTKEYA